MKIKIFASTPKYGFFIISLFIMTVPSILANGQEQDLFDSFTVLNKGGQNYVSWEFKNEKGQNVKRIGIQRSKDSIVFSTIGHADNPSFNRNEFVDKKPPPGANYYRLFIFFKDGSYAFSGARKIILIPSTLSNSRVNIPVSFQPSIFVYTNPEGNVNISIADAKKNDYTIRFYDDAGQFLFEINEIKKSLLIIDKVNFLHSGWFHFKLYRNGEIFEEWKFHISD